MKQIRMNVFETNSSSTHSISIYKGKIETGGSIPANGKIMSNDLLTAYDCEFNDELRKLLGKLGYKESQSGKTSGSRVAFCNETTGHIIRLHKPHPTNVLKQYQIEQIVEELKARRLV